MKLKKRVIPMLAGLLTAVMLTSTASAHQYDYWNGKYIGKNGAHIILRITKSAQTDLLNYADVYSHGCDWNGISSNVSVSIAYEQTGMPALDGEMWVMGRTYSEGVLGETIPYDSNGQIMKKGSGYAVEDDWARVIIYMNTDPVPFKETTIPIEMARKAFTHEVGHALKLRHPLATSETDIHIFHVYINGSWYYVPKAVMNQDAPVKSNEHVSPTIAPHDRACLIAKWGV